MAKKNMLLFAALALAGFGGSFYGGTLVSPRFMGEAEDATDVAPAGTVEIEAGRIALHLPGQDLPAIVEVKIISEEGEAPALEDMRDKLQTMIANVLDMPIVTTGGASIERIEDAVVVVASQEAPWLKGIEMTLLSNIAGPS